MTVYKPSFPALHQSEVACKHVLSFLRWAPRGRQGELGQTLSRGALRNLLADSRKESIIGARLLVENPVWNPVQSYMHPGIQPVSNQSGRPIQYALKTVDNSQILLPPQLGVPATHQVLQLCHLALRSIGINSSRRSLRMGILTGLQLSAAAPGAQHASLSVCSRRSASFQRGSKTGSQYMIHPFVMKLGWVGFDG